jgi:hypothetical protein
MQQLATLSELHPAAQVAYILVTGVVLVALVVGAILKF